VAVRPERLKNLRDDDEEKETSGESAVSRIIADGTATTEAARARVRRVENIALEMKIRKIGAKLFIVGLPL
tara:strand:+ start:156 stop:368 length:213 start_codon:yes stop_codon:yes gene_type:complete